ncbi:MAG: indolepyruvate ferredoxin oxidoreductase family protein, partial [Betaproteobacteria bacterium]
HSGLLAIRAAIASNVNITYKILYNDAVAMTGGQPIDGPISVPQVARQLSAEGVRRIIVLAEDPQHYPGDAGFPPDVDIRAREDLEVVQRELRQTPGVTALIYDQTCAAEKRRRRKRGSYPDPATRVFINEMVCEGCGDCGTKSNCLSIVPVETEFGRKRAIDQFSCNKDYSCVEGLCPSFVTVEGGSMRRGKGVTADAAMFTALPEPTLPDLSTPYGILIAGVGGTGVITIGALIGMAAHLEGKGVSLLDMTGLAQKGGAVMSHVRLAARQDQLSAVRIATGEARIVLGCDILVAASDEVLFKAQAGFTRAIINTGQAITGDFVRNPDHPFPLAAMQEQIADAVGTGAADFLGATRLASILSGDAIMTNMFLLGYAYQKGLVPVSSVALIKAIELNSVAVAANTQAFLWGRRTVHDPEGIEKLAQEHEPAVPAHRLSRNLEEIVARRSGYLTAYQDQAYARRYTELVDRIRRAEDALKPGSSLLTEAVARGYFKLLAYKDEYEVARLYTAPEFARTLDSAFEGKYKLRFHLAVPALSRNDPVSGEPVKRSYGAWLMPAFRILAPLKFLRGTPFDPFGYGAERRMERRLIKEYEATLSTLLADLRPESLASAAEIARLPEDIRGYGPVKERNFIAAQNRQAELMKEFNRGSNN